MYATIRVFAVVALCVTAAVGQTVDVTVRVDRPVHRVSRYLTGACIEDVNHEIYGGIFSQMVFGESFEEPDPAPPLKGFVAFDGEWSAEDGVLRGSAGSGPKLIGELPPFRDGEVSVEVRLDGPGRGNAGLIVRVARAGRGADNFDGYEVSLDAAAQVVRLGRHRHDWTLLRDTPCRVPPGEWIPLRVKLDGSVVEVFVAGESIVRFDDGATALPAGTVGLRQWQRRASYRNLRVRSAAGSHPIAFETNASTPFEVSGMWRPLRRGTATGACALIGERPFVGTQSQRLSFISGEGAFGIENRGLNRQGMHFVGGRPYEGLVCARANAPIALHVSLESARGDRVHAETALALEPGDWQCLDFTLSPRETETDGRLTITLREPGAVVVGYVFLEPGPWGRFHGLPVRRDVAEALIEEGITVLRYGGSMVNHPEYRWKNMIGPRERRPPYRGHWYPYSSNGWGIVEFIAFCNAAGFLSIPAFNMGETPEDMAAFVEYVNGSEETTWGRRRAADGHPEPYRLRHLELGNEERVDEAYAAKFEALADAIWSRDPAMTIVVGDFVYRQPIRDPGRVSGAVSGITSLAGQRRILEFAKRHDREVWFDVHVGTDGPRPDSTFEAMLSYVDALEKLADGARHRVVVFEFNSGNHSQRRAIANALAINAIERDGRIPIAASANCLQVDGQNDNGWNQGLLFLNPRKVWLQPPGYVTRMVSRNYQPFAVPAVVRGDAGLDVSAKRSEDNHTLVLQVVNASGRDVETELELVGYTPSRAVALVETLAAPLGAFNTAREPERVVPTRSEWPHGFNAGRVRRTFPAWSVTVIRFE